MFLAEEGNKNYAVEARNRWKDILEAEGSVPINDSYKRDVTVRLLENQAKFMSEAAPTNSMAGSNSGTGPITTWDPILISMIRRAAPSLIAFDVMGVQPMTGPVGLIFSMKSRYVSQTGAEAGFNEAVGTHSNAGVGTTGEALDVITLAITASVDFVTTETLSVASGEWTGIVTTISGTGTQVMQVKTVAGTLKRQLQIGEAVTGGTAGVGVVLSFHSTAMTRTTGEALGDTANNIFPEMAFSIDKTSVTARTRALKAEYSLELAQDLRAVHGMDAETELANILSQEITAEINREMINTLYFTAKAGAQVDTAVAGTFNLDTDSNGRWSVERFKGLMFQLERDANAIGRETRRGRGNLIICSSDVASALSMAGKLDTSPALSNNLQVDDTGNTYAGVLNGKYKVYIDPYWNNSTQEFYMVGYKGPGFADAGAFYAPYVPLEMVRAIGQETFQPKIAFKTRYGVVANPFVDNTGAQDTTLGAINRGNNPYYRRVTVLNVM